MREPAPARGGGSGPLLSRVTALAAITVVVGLLPWLSGRDPALALLRATLGTIFIAHGEDHYNVAPGQTIARVYRVEQVTSAAVTSMLVTGSAATTSHRTGVGELATASITRA